jgi:hypothetical protein
MNPFYPIEINGEKYLICKLSDREFSTLHDPATKQIVGQWNNDAAQYEIFTPADHKVQEMRTHLSGLLMTEREFERHMNELISSGRAFKFEH